MTDFSNITMDDLWRFVSGLLNPDGTESVSVFPHIVKYRPDRIELTYSVGNRYYKLQGREKSAKICVLTSQQEETGISKEVSREWQGFLFKKFGRSYVPMFSDMANYRKESQA